MKNSFSEPLLNNNAIKCQSWRNTVSLSSHLEIVAPYCLSLCLLANRTVSLAMVRFPSMPLYFFFWLIALSKSKTDNKNYCRQHFGNLLVRWRVYAKCCWVMQRLALTLWWDQMIRSQYDTADADQCHRLSRAKYISQEPLVIMVTMCVCGLLCGWGRGKNLSQR